MSFKYVSLYSLAEWKNGLAFKQIHFAGQGKPVIKIAELKNGITAQTAYTQQTFDDSVYLTKGDMVFSWSGNPETSIRNMSAYIRKMALGGYVLHVDLEPVKELVSLQRRCANNLNQAAIHANSYGGLYPDELKRLQKDYADLWGPLSDLLAQLSAIVTM